MIFCGALAFGKASLLVGLASFLGSRRAALLGLVVGRRLFGGGGGGISSAESTSCSRDDAVSVRVMPGRVMVCCGGYVEVGVLVAAVTGAGCLKLDCEDIAEGVLFSAPLLF
jgi:hypothetical protein